MHWYSSILRDYFLSYLRLIPAVGFPMEVGWRLYIESRPRQQWVKLWNIVMDCYWKRSVWWNNNQTWSNESQAWTDKLHRIYSKYLVMTTLSDYEIKHWLLLSLQVIWKYCNCDEVLLYLEYKNTANKMTPCYNQDRYITVICSWTVMKTTERSNFELTLWLSSLCFSKTIERFIMLSHCITLPSSLIGDIDIVLLSLWLLIF